MCCVFFFKPKTAYELRISDWSSDVCSSDLRIGDLYLIGVPAEVTIVAGLRLRRAVAEVVGVPVRKVLVQGYANHYMHYVTTPEEYDSQEYEGASTIFGRNELPALTQVSVGLARAMRSGKPVPIGDKASQPTPFPATTRSEEHTSELQS